MRSEATAPLLVEGLSAEFWTEMGRLTRRPFSEDKKGATQVSMPTVFRNQFVFLLYVSFCVHVQSVR